VTSHHIGRVILWMTGALVSFCVLAVSVRGLAGVLNIFEILTVRSLVGLIVIVLLLAVRADLRAAIAPRKLGTHLARSGIHFAAQWAWTLGITLLPLATVFALEFTMPAWTALLAALLLGEKLTPSRLGVVVLGLLGVLIILRPGLEAFQTTSLWVLAAAVGFAMAMILTKHLTATETTMSIVFWMNLMQLPMGLAGADSLLFPLRLGWEHVPSVFGMGIGSLAAHLCISNAMRSGDATLVVPFDFLRIPLIALVGWWLYNEPLDVFVFIGASVIIAGVLWNLRAESRRPAKDGALMAEADRNAGAAGM